MGNSGSKTSLRYVAILFELVYKLTTTRTTSPAPLKVIRSLYKKITADKKKQERQAKKDDILGIAPPDTLKGPVVADLDLLESLDRDMDFACAAYLTIKAKTCSSALRYDIDQVCKLINIKPEDVIFLDATNRLVERPCFVCIDRKGKRIAVNIRGTASLIDAIADGVGLSKVIASGIAAHMAAHDSALDILAEIKGSVIKAFKETGYPLVFIGHSLGAAVAALCAWEVRNYLLTNHEDAKSIAEAVGDKVSAVCFCCPPVLTMNACEDSSSYITSLANERDPVVRANMVNGWQCLARIRRDKDVAEIIPLPAQDELNNYDIENAHSVPAHLPPGIHVIYPMFAPGLLLHLIPVRNKDPSDEKIGKDVAAMDVSRVQDKRINWLPECFGANLKKNSNGEAFERVAREAKIQYQVVAQADGKDRWSVLAIEPVHAGDHSLVNIAPAFKTVIAQLKNPDNGGKGVTGPVFAGSNKVHPAT